MVNIVIAMTTLWEFIAQFNNWMRFVEVLWSRWVLGAIDELLKHFIKFHSGIVIIYATS